MNKSIRNVSTRMLRGLIATLLSLLFLMAPLAPLTATAGREMTANNKDMTPSEGAENDSSLYLPIPSSVSPPKPMLPLAPAITATLADDIGLGVKKNPGDTITYTATITNTGVSPADDALNVIFSDILDSNTTLVGGSVNAQPIAKPDSYTASGNIPISLAAPGVLTNDVDPMTGTNAGLTVTEVQGSAVNVGVATNTTAVGRGAVNGSVTLNANGSFTYEPPPGFTGNDTFTYKTSEGTLTDTTTVTITISNMVWFIKNTGGGLNRGTFSNPFTTIAAFNTANAASGAVPDPKNGDFIALRTGTYSEADGVNLRNTQKLIGEAVQFSTVFTADSNSSSAYTTFAGATNTAPTINTTAGNGVDLADSNTVRGLNVGNTPGFFGFNGGAVGSPVINTVGKTGTGGAINVSTSGTFGANVTFATLESSSSPGANINLVGVTGTLGITSGGAGLTGSAASSNAINISGGSVGFTYAANVTKSTAGALLNVAGGHTGTLTFNTGTLSATAGTGLQFDNADGTYNFNGTTTLNGGDAGVDILNGSSGTFSFGSNASISNPTGTAFNVNASAPASMTYSGNITANTNRAVSISNGAAAACGTQTFQTGSITGSGASATGIIINNCNAGTMTFSGSAVTLTTQANNGVTLTNNAGATVDFSGGNLDVSTTTGKAFTATGGGTIKVGGASNTLATNTVGTGNTILEVQNTTIGTGGLNFVSLSGNGNSAITKGVYLLNAGSGGLTVTGTGSTAGSGGTIQNYTQKGIHVDTTNNISLSNMNISGNGTANLDTSAVCGDIKNGTNTNCAAGVDLQTVTTASMTGVHISNGVQAGLNGRNVTGLTLTTVEVNNAGNETNECGIQLSNLFGTMTWTSLNIHDNASRQLNIQNATTPAVNLTINTSTFANTTWPGSATSAQGILFSGSGTANMTISVQNSTIARNFGPALQSDSSTGATLNTTFNGGSLVDNGQHFVIASTGSGNMNYALTNVLTAWVNGTAVTGHSQVTPISIFNAGSGAFVGSITGNTFGLSTGMASDANSAACNGGCNVMVINNSASTGSDNATVTGNTIRRSGGGGISVLSGGGVGSTSTMRVKIESNTLNSPDGNGTGLPIAVTNTTVVGDATSTCANILNNSINNTGGAGTWNIANAIRLRNPIATAGPFTLPGYSGAATDYTAVVNYLNGRNTITGGSASVQAVGNYSNTAGGSDCFLTLAHGGVARYHDALFSGIFDGDQSSTSRPFSFVSGVTLNHPLRSISDWVNPDVSFPGSTSNISSQLDQHQLDSIVIAALERWRIAGLTTQQLATLGEMKFEIADLPGSYLGEASDNSILVDRYASGKDWYLGADQRSDSLFRNVVAATRLYTDPMSAPAGHIDLLTAIEHEMGHRLGLADVYSANDRDNLMYGYLTVGERRLPAPGQANGAQSGALKGTHFLSLAFAAKPLDVRKVSDLSTDRSLSSSGLCPGVGAEPQPIESRLPVGQSHHRTSGGRAGESHLWSAVASAARHRFGLTRGTAQSAASVGALQEKNHAGTRLSVNRFSASGDKSLSPLSGETVTVNGSGSGFTVPGGDSVTITFQATVNTPPLVKSVSTQGSVTGSNFTLVNGISTTPNTNDPETGAVNDATVTNINVTSTWTGATSTDWNTITNWNPSSYAPGVSNPAINDVVIPNVGNQPNIGTTDIGVFSLNISNGRTLTITSPRILTIGGSPGGNLTLDGIISGGELRLGTGTHAVNNAGGTGSLSSTNLMTVQSGSTVTLNNNLSMGALAVNAGGSMDITNRTLTLTGPGAALSAVGTFTTTGSTVVFASTTGAQTTGTVYNNLTINNAAGVTLTGDSTVNGVLALTSGDLNTGAFTLTQPNTTASTGTGDVVGNVKRTGAPLAATALTYGNPNNMITLGANTLTSLNIRLTKTAPDDASTGIANSGFPGAVTRTYVITPAGGTFTTATLRLHYLDTELNSNAEGSLRLWKLITTPITGWQQQDPSGAVTTFDSAANWVQKTGVTGFSPWTIASVSPTAANGNVSGRIVDNNGNPVEGAVVNLSGTQNRKFITDSNGYYSFDNVETNGFYSVTPSRANYTFSPAQRSFSQLGNNTDAAFTASVTNGTALNPLDTPEYFVRQQYLDFLGREPDESGFNFWSDQILSCNSDAACVEGKRINTSAAFFLSIEFQQTGYLVYRMYQSAYGDIPGAPLPLRLGEFRPDTAEIGNGVIVNRSGWETVLENNKQAYVAEFVQRARFLSLYGNVSDGQFVDTLNHNAGFVLSQAERDQLVSDLSSQAKTRAQVLRAVAENSTLAQQEFSQAFVLMQYFGYLRRDPNSGPDTDFSGYNFWLNKLNTFGGNFQDADMVKAFLVAGEYRGRFPR